MEARCLTGQPNRGVTDDEAAVSMLASGIVKSGLRLEESQRFNMHSGGGS